MDPVYQWYVILDVGRSDYPLLLTRGRGVYNGFSKNPALFLNPNPALPVLETSLDELDTAQQSVLARIPGATGTRLLKAGVVATNLGLARSYVQSLVDANPEQGAMLIQAAGMKSRRQTAYAKPMLQATQEVASGPVHLVANVGLLRTGIKGRVLFNWQLSSDGGKTWLSTPPTPHGSTDVAGLTPLLTYAFRVSITSRKGPGAWSEAVTLLVR